MKKYQLRRVIRQNAKVISYRVARVAELADSLEFLADWLMKIWPINDDTTVKVMPKSYSCPVKVLADLPVLHWNDNPSPVAPMPDTYTVEPTRFPVGYTDDNRGHIFDLILKAAFVREKNIIVIWNTREDVRGYD